MRRQAVVSSYRRLLAFGGEKSLDSFDATSNSFEWPKLDVSKQTRQGELFEVSMAYSSDCKMPSPDYL
jgi:hypothetical protein